VKEKKYKEKGCTIKMRNSKSSAKSHLLYNVVHRVKRKGGGGVIVPG